MQTVKEITDKDKAPVLNKGAAKRFLRNALWEPTGDKGEVFFCKHHKNFKNWHLFILVSFIYTNLFSLYIQCKYIVLFNVQCINFIDLDKYYFFAQSVTFFKLLNNLLFFLYLPGNSNIQRNHIFTLCFIFFFSRLKIHLVSLTGHYQLWYIQLNCLVIHKLENSNAFDLSNDIVRNFQTILFSSLLHSQLNYIQ